MRACRENLDAVCNILRTGAPGTHGFAEQVSFSKVPDDRDSTTTKKVHDLLITRTPAAKRIVKVGATINCKSQKRSDGDRVFFGLFLRQLSIERIALYLRFDFTDKLHER